MSRPAGASTCDEPYEVAVLRLQSAVASETSDLAESELDRWLEDASLRGRDDGYVAQLYFFDGGLSDRTVAFSAYRLEETE